ncbi:MAG TPA: S41 family peptidase [Puia sp.]
MIRKLKTYSWICVAICLTASCTSLRNTYSPQKKYSPAVIQTDYTLFRHILETTHPSIYWYTTKDSMDYYFEQVYKTLNDSMTEIQFRDQMAYVISKLDCGHTTMKGSKAFSKYVDTASSKAFPFALKFWSDTMVITANLRRNDPILQRGTIVQSINGYTARALTDTLFNYITTDGYSANGKYQSLSTGFAFANLFKNVLGLTDSFDIHYIDSMGNERQAWVQPFDFKADTMNKSSLNHGPPAKGKRPEKKKEKPFFFYSSANLQLDTVMKTGFMTVATFDRSNHLKKFFRRSFKVIHKEKIKNLIIDVRSNGGGDAGLSTKLTRYIIDHKFKLADSLYTIKPPSKYKKYMEKSFLYGMLISLVTRKESDDKYHFRYFERHYNSPKKKNHYYGKVFILIGGNSFSATTLFAGDLKGQKNVTLVGEETGGGYYGNTAWIIPDVTLPNTGLRFRLPRFRMVINKDRFKNGRGIMPDVWALPTSDAIRDGVDFKAMKVRELIAQQDALTNHDSEDK